MNEAISPAAVPQTLTEQACFDIRETLAGRRRGVRAMLPFVGPAVVASIAYMDPGNFATNIQAGAGYGYTLLWVVAVANGVAMLFQSLSAKLGLVTGRNLAELCRSALPRRCVFAMWAISEIAAMATDLAEFVGGAIGVSLLTRLPMLPGMLITAAVTYGLLQFDKRGFRPLELAIAALVGVIGLSVSRRVADCAGTLAVGASADVLAAHAGSQCVDDLGRHCRRDRDAACAVSAFGSDAKSRETSQ